MEPFVDMLAGGHSNSLGRTVEVVAAVLADENRLDELFHCYQSADPVVRLRVSSSLKRIEQARHDLIVASINRILDEVCTQPHLREQPSAQWTVAQIFLALTHDLTPHQYQRAKVHMQSNLETMGDWIVLAQTMETLAQWSKSDAVLAKWLKPRLELRVEDPRPSVSKKAGKCLILVERLLAKST